jgi:hypothetical protein
MKSKNPLIAFSADEPLVLFPKLTATIGLEWLTEDDTNLLEKLAERGETPEHTSNPLKPAVLRSGANGFLIKSTGCHFSDEARQKILQAWKMLGAGNNFCAILQAAQNQLIERIFFEEDGMIVEPRQAASIGKIGKKKLKRKSVRRLLQTLKLSYEQYWPIEQLANIVEPYARKTR